MKTAISFLGSHYDFPKIIDLISTSDCDYIHIDIADGLFVSNVTPFDKEMLDILKSSNKKKDVHLMTLSLKKFIDLFSYIEPEMITFHYEATTKHNKIIDYIKTKECKVGIAINPLTDVEKLIPLFNKIDLVLVMSIIPGYSGQKFIDSTPSKIKKLVDLRNEYKANFEISVDGGINEETIKLLKNAKPDIVVSGSFVYKSDDFNKQLEKLK